MSVFSQQFAELDALADWAHAEELDRAARRRASSPEELQFFYDTLKPRLEEALNYLDGFPLHDMPLPEKKLLHLVLMMVEVAVAVEKFDGVGVVPFAIPPEQFRPITPAK